MFLRKYNAATHIYIPIIKRGVVDFAVGADWTPASGDVKISKDGGAAANATNLPTAITMGNTACWDFSLTAGELSAAKIIVTVADSATKAVEDQAFVVHTFGNASAEYAVDLGDSTALGLSRLDATVSSRASQSSLDAVDDHVDTEIAAIKARTDNLPASPAATSDCITAAGVRTAVGMASANLDTQLDALPTASENATTILAAAVEGLETLAECLRLIRAAVVGKSDGFPSGSVHFRDKADSKNRITATVDSDGNRTAVAVDAS